MKKQFLLSLIAAFVMALSANAQGNTYNMKVKMADGTEITIGPNDIENISFNEAVVVSGIKLRNCWKNWPASACGKSATTAIGMSMA